MSWRSKVVWSSGMFLQPHHFQQETRYLERLVDARARCSSPFAWGFSQLQLDDGLLALGKLGIAQATGMLPDGTPFSMPHLDALPLPMAVPDDVKGELIYLALPVQREGLNEFDYGTAEADSLSRFQAIQEDVRDNTSSVDEPATIQVGRLRLRLVRAKEAGDAFALLGVALVAERRGDGQVVLNRDYIAPQSAVGKRPENAVAPKQSAFVCQCLGHRPADGLFQRQRSSRAFFQRVWTRTLRYLPVASIR